MTTSDSPIPPAHHIHFGHHGEPGLIEVRVRSLRQLFNSLDPTPFPEKDLDEDAEEFIVGWAMEHGADSRFTIRIHVSEPTEADTAAYRADEIGPAVRHYFDYRAQVLRRRFRRLMIQGRLSLVIGLCVLATAFGISHVLAMFGESRLNDFLRESAVIGGWVAMWQPLQIFLYEWWPLRHERRVYERLSRSDVIVMIGGEERGEAGKASDV